MADSKLKKVEDQVVAPPDVIEELDRLKFQVALEKQNRIQAQLQLLQAQLQAAAQERGAAERALAAKYQISPADQVDLETGRISRHGGTLTPKA